MTRYIKINGTKLADVINGSGLAEKIKGKAGNDIINGGAGSDKIKGNGGNDVITAGAGNDDIDGGGGVDVAVYSGLIDQYTLSFRTNGDLKGTVTDLAANRDGTDTLKNVEFLRFANAIYDVANDITYLLNTAPTLNAIAGVTYNDTADDDTFAAANGILAATDAENDTLTFAIAGGAADLSLGGSIFRKRRPSARFISTARPAPTALCRTTVRSRP